MTENEIATALSMLHSKSTQPSDPGLLESVYQAALSYELQKRGLRVVQQVGLPVYYEAVKLELASVST